MLIPLTIASIEKNSGETNALIEKRSRETKSQQGRASRKVTHNVEE
jgi:hypothetical protein